jgi:hypothetical protein
MIAQRVGLTTLVATLAVMLLGHSAAAADVAAFRTGNDIYRWCTTSPAGEACLAYIGGVSDAMARGDEIFGSRACFPASMTHARVRDIAVAFLKAHADFGRYNGASLLAAAFAEAFPCKP